MSVFRLLTNHSCWRTGGSRLDLVHRSGCGATLRWISTREADNLTRKIFSTENSSVNSSLQLESGMDQELQLQEHLSKHVDTMDATNIANVIFLAAKHGLKLDANKLDLMTQRLRRKNVTLNKLIVSKMLYGFRTQSDCDNHVKKFLKVLTQKVIASEMVILDGQGVGNSLYGLQRMTCESVEVKGLISELRHHVEHCTNNLKSQEIGNALYGLQNMSSETIEVKRLVSVLADRIQSCREQLNAQSIGNSIYGLQKMDSYSPEVRKLLTSLHRKITASRETMSGQNIGNAFYGLQKMSSDHREVRSLIKALGAKLKEFKQCFKPQEVSNALFGLQRMDSGHAEVREILQLFAMKIKRSTQPLDSQGIGNILYGMQNMSSDNEAVRDLLGAILANLAQHDAKLTLSEQEISNAMYGMQGMDVTDSEVQAMLKFLHLQLIGCAEPITCQAIGSIMYGLQNKTCDHKVVRDILRTVCQRVNSLSEPLDIITFGSAMYSLHSMSSDVIEVRQLLIALCERLTPEMPVTEDSSTYTRSLLAALYGMQCMDSENPDVRKVLTLLTCRLQLCEPSNITAQGFGSAIYGMQLMTCSVDHPETEALFRVLYEKVSTNSKELIDIRAIGSALFGLISSMKNQPDPNSRVVLTNLLTLLLNATDEIIVVSSTKTDSENIPSMGDLQNLWRSFVLFSHFTDASPVMTSEIKARIARLCTELSQLTPHSTLHITPHDNINTLPGEAKELTRIEQRVQDQVKAILQNKPTVHITYNEMLYGFESDIVLRVTSTDNAQQTALVPDIIRNVEVDGITHLQPRKRKFCNLRDIYLEDKYGIKVSRIRLPDRQNISDDSLYDAVMGHLNGLKLFVSTQQAQHTFF